MGAATLNPAIAVIDETSATYELYSRLYEGMKSANSVDAPKFDPPQVDEQGNVIDPDYEKNIKQALAEYSDILMKNSAYLYANSIITVVGEGHGGGGAGGDFVSRNGDSMVGTLAALYGFQAGVDGSNVLEITKHNDDTKWVEVDGNIDASNNVSVGGELHLSSSGIYFSDNQIISYEGVTLNIASQNISMTGDIVVDGSIKIGDVEINENGVMYGDKMFYHSGNSNMATVSWTMLDGNVYGNLSVLGKATINEFETTGSFKLCANSKPLFISVSDKLDDGTTYDYTEMRSDLSLANGCSIKFDDKYIIKVRKGTDSIVSFAAPGMILNLGDSDGETKTKHIALQTGIYNSSSDYCMISSNGDADFRNSFSAGCGNAANTVISTYYDGKDNCGISVMEELRFGGKSAPVLRGNGTMLSGTMPYTRVTGDSVNTEAIGFDLSCQMTTSSFRDQSKEWSATLCLSTDAEFIAFDKPTEAESFCIKSEQYKTSLQENALFFSDNVYLEGITGGIKHSGDSLFIGNVSSDNFTSGFAGSGWAIKKASEKISATFDDLIVRRKMRIYELEVQKMSVTNGSLWVSDSCSGDEVIEL